MNEWTILHQTFLKDTIIKNNRCKLWNFNWNLGVYVCGVQQEMVESKNVSLLTRKSSSKLTDTILPCDPPTCSLLEFVIIINMFIHVYNTNFDENITAIWNYHFHWTYHSTKDNNKSILFWYFHFYIYNIFSK